MKIIDGKGTPMGRLASFAAKEALKGEEVIILNCNEVIITGNFKTTKEKFDEKRSRTGSSQKGPKHPAISEKIVKRAINGMLPDARMGRGKEALKRVKCYNQVPKEYESIKTIKIPTENKLKYSEVKRFTK